MKVNEGDSYGKWNTKGIEEETKQVQGFKSIKSSRLEYDWDTPTQNMMKENTETLVSSAYQGSVCVQERTESKKKDLFVDKESFDSLKQRVEILEKLFCQFQQKKDGIRSSDMLVEFSLQYQKHMAIGLLDDVPAGKVPFDL